MIGNIFLNIGLAASLFTILMYYLTWKGYGNTKTAARTGYHIMSVSVIASSIILFYAIMTHQYQYKYVFNYSGSDLPVGLLMSTFYAGQEGSLLLWLLFTAIIGLILLDYTSKRGDLEPRVMMVFTLAATFLLVMVNPILKSPFEYLWSEASFVNIKYINQAFLSNPFITNFVFEDPGTKDTFIRISPEFYSAMMAEGIRFGDFLIQGKGLNPLLQNFWMQIHPPLLFFGFAMSTVPFSFAVSSIMNNEYREWVKQSLPWLLAAMMILGLAIMLGGYWAYGVLGWGGYWGWDPVENSSLVPWIIGVAAIHTMLVQKKTASKDHPGRFVKTNLILGVMTFVFVIYSTFLTRSGILSDASVHSFVAPGRIVFLFLMVFMVLFTLIGLGGVAYRWKYLTKNFSFEENMMSRELALFTGSVGLLASAAIILFGTSAPIWGSAVEIRFYNELNLPIAIIIGVINGLSILLKWKFTKGEEILKKSRFSLIVTILLTAAIIFLGGVYDLMLAIFTLTTTFSLVVNAEIAWKIFMGNKLYLGAYISHAGIALFFLGVIATGGFTKDYSVDLERDKPVEVLGHTLTFKGFEPFDNGKKYKFNIEVEDGSSKTVAAPVMYIAEFNNSLMREPDILQRFFNDFYISPLSYTEGKDRGNSSGADYSLEKGNSVNFNGRKITFIKFNFSEDAMSAMMSGEEFSIGALLNIDYQDKSEQVELIMKNVQGTRSYLPVEAPETGLSLKMTTMDASGKVGFSVSEPGAEESVQQTEIARDVIAIEASVKPFINLVWGGVIFMTLGFFISVIRRSRESTKS